MSHQLKINHKEIGDQLPDMTNIPSGLKEASKVEFAETGFTL